MAKKPTLPAGPVNQHKKMATGQMPKPAGKPTAKC